MATQRENKASSLTPAEADREEIFKIIQNAPKPPSLGEVAGQAPSRMSYAMVSYHLKVLVEDKRLIKKRSPSDGRKSIYKVVAPAPAPEPESKPSKLLPRGLFQWDYLTITQVLDPLAAGMTCDLCGATIRAPKKVLNDFGGKNCKIRDTRDPDAPQAYLNLCRLCVERLPKAWKTKKSNSTREGQVRKILDLAGKLHAKLHEFFEEEM
jgi:hypothetical protein